MVFFHSVTEAMTQSKIKGAISLEGETEILVGIGSQLNPSLQDILK